jgi:PKD repeat protein
MKTTFLFISIFIFTLRLHAQNYCPFVYYVSPGSYTITFSPNSSYTGAQYHHEWNFGDSSAINTMSNPVHTYSSGGSHYVTCVNYDASNNPLCTTGHMVYLSPPYNCTFDVMQLSVSDSFAFSAQPLSGASVEWDFGDGTSISYLNPVVHAYSGVPGVYNCTSYQKDSLGNIICQHTQQMTFGTNCTFTSHADTANLQSVTFWDMSSSPFVYWDFGDGSSDSGASATHLYSSSGFFTVCMTTTDSNGIVICQTCDSVVAGVGCSFQVQPNASMYGYDFSTNANGYQIAWNFGDGSTGSGASTSYSYANPGTYHVCMDQIDTITGNTFCSTCQTVVTGTPPCHADFMVSTQALTAFFIDQSTVDPSSTYLWNFGDGATAMTRFPQHTYNSAGYYTVCLTYTNSSCTDMYCDSIYIGGSNPTCNALFAIVQIAPYQITIANLASGNSLHYNWDFGDGMSDTTAYPMHFYSVTGSYNLCLTVSDTTGCSDTYCDTLRVDSLGNIFRLAQSGFTVTVMSAGQITSVIADPVAVKDLKIYPNPFGSELNISFANADKKGKFTIYSIEQKMIATGRIENGQGKIETSKFATGSYLIEIRLEDGSKAYRMLLKK